MTPRQRHGALVVGYALVTMTFAFMAWAASSRMRESFVNADVVAGSVAWPTWVASLPVTLGFATIWLRVAHRLCRARTVGDHRYLADRTAAAERAALTPLMATVRQEWATQLDKRGPPGTEILSAFEAAFN